MSLQDARRYYQAGKFREALLCYLGSSKKYGGRAFTANILFCLKALSKSSSKNHHTDFKLIASPQNEVAQIRFSGLVVSLTSYPARIAAVSKTIESIQRQILQPERIILWLASEQFPRRDKDLPKQLIEAVSRGYTEIKWCDDIKSYKKIIPLLDEVPDYVIVTADDDVIYNDHWLIELVIEHLLDDQAIVCHRAHRLTFSKNGIPTDYRYWIRDIATDGYGFDYFFTGVGGVLYPPNSLDCRATDRKLFQTLCPHGDDIWLWAMAVLNRRKIRRVRSGTFKLDLIPGTQDEALWQQNVEFDRNNKMLLDVLSTFPEIKELIQEKSSCSILGGQAPLVSLVMPIYNTGVFLNGSIGSLLNQTYENIEIICVNDGSRDAITLKILGNIARKNSKLRIYHQDNSGPGSARNFGLAMASGDFVGFIDSDDFVSSDFVESLVNGCIMFDSDVAVTSQIFTIEKSGSLARKRTALDSSSVTATKEELRESILATGSSCNKLYRRSFLLDNGIRFLENNKSPAEDNYFSALSLVLTKRPVAILQKGTYFYRNVGGSITSTHSEESISESAGVYRELVSNLKNRKEVNDRRYWLNVVYERARKDIRHQLIASGRHDVKGRKLILEFRGTVSICLIADDRYVQQTQVTIASILVSKDQSTRISIAILTPVGCASKFDFISGLLREDVDIILMEVDLAPLVSLHKSDAKDANFCIASPSAMFKFMIPDLFKELDRILYLDCDLIVRKDIYSLFMTDLGSSYLAAVTDMWSSVTERNLVSSSSTYFNSGVMLMNLRAMREHQLTAKLIEAKSKSNNFQLMDQDVFNEVCAQNVLFLDIKYNFLPVCYKRHSKRLKIADINQIYRSRYASLDEVARDPVVAHWAGSDKPWVTSDVLFADEWKKLLEMASTSGRVALDANISMVGD